jgi:hypothetical protein
MGTARAVKPDSARKSHGWPDLAGRCLDSDVNMYYPLLLEPSIA